MADIDAPFSARYRGQHCQIESAFPSSARTALLHLLYDLKDRGYVAGWPAIARELQRIGRQPPIKYDSSSTAADRQAREDAQAGLNSLKWEKAYDFCERLHNHLAQDVISWLDYETSEVATPKSEVQEYIARELERVFLEEGLAYEFFNGLVRRRGRKHTVEKATRAQVVLGDNRLADTRKHYEKALQFFRHPTKPDYENCVKEAVCSIEAAGKSLFPEARAATLGDLANWFVRQKDYPVPRALVKTIEGIYAYRSGGDGVGHGGAKGGTATAEVAEYVLSVSASQIIYLVDLASTNEEIPF
ncbi:hypothetical protein [Algiphilus sp.]|uniref:hypothetical protein n=1 Tax=Algiphilus sp. TaxID=1872431 RepID=UPI003BABC37A